MKKNVTILDISGNIIGTTYPKRAKGLVKSGRACFVDGETVQLACPPGQLIQKQQEDTIMVTETIDAEIKQEKLTEGKEPAKTEEEVSENAKKLLNAGISLKDILSNLDNICSDNGYINQALANLEKLPYVTPVEGAPLDTSIAARAEAAANIVKCRETTNQMMIKLYTQIYTDYMA